MGPAHDFYMQTSNNVLKLYLRNCERFAQDQQVFAILLCILENIKKYV